MCGVVGRLHQGWLVYQHSKTPARSKATAGVRFAKACFAPGRKPGYVLDFALGCRCQGVGNWELPGGVMSVQHPPSSLTTSRIWH